MFIGKKFSREDSKFNWKLKIQSGFTVNMKFLKLANIKQFYIQIIKLDSEKIKIQVSKLTFNINLTITKNSRNFLKNFKNM